MHDTRNRNEHQPRYRIHTRRNRLRRAEAVYAERGRQDAKGGLVYFPSSPDNWPGLKARFKAEDIEALKRFDAEMRSH